LILVETVAEAGFKRWRVYCAFLGEKRPALAAARDRVASCDTTSTARGQAHRPCDPLRVANARGIDLQELRNPKSATQKSPTIYNPSLIHGDTES